MQYFSDSQDEHSGTRQHKDVAGPVRFLSSHI